MGGLFALGSRQGTFGDASLTPQQDGLEPFGAWLGRIDVGEPYTVAPGTEDRVIADIRRDFSGWHSAYYQPGWAAQASSKQETAVYSISGWTDDLFPPVESFRMFSYLKSLDPLWPVAVGVADVGHSRAQNKPATWHRLNDQAFQFLSAHIHGSHRQQTTVFSEATLCPGNTPNQTSADQLTATTPQGLANGTLTVRYARGAVLSAASGLDDPDGPGADAVFGEVAEPHADCRYAQGPVAGGTGYTAYSIPLHAREVTVGVGHVTVSYAASGGVEAVLAARLWDVAPDGGALLVTRGVYRLDFNGYDSLAGTVQVPFYGNTGSSRPGTGCGWTWPKSTRRRTGRPTRARRAHSR